MLIFHAKNDQNIGFRIFGRFKKPMAIWMEIDLKKYFTNG